MRWLLAGYTGLAPRQICYRYGPLGKPYLDLNSADIKFNATDSGDTLLIALHQSSELGLDVEAIPRKVNYPGIAKRKLTSGELELLWSLPQVQRTNAFLALWTRKEGYGKAIGLGIRYPMNQVNLCDNLDDETYIMRQTPEQCWHLLQIAGEGFVACLVSSRQATGIKYYTLDIDALELRQ